MDITKDPKCRRAQYGDMAKLIHQNVSPNRHIPFEELPVEEQKNLLVIAQQAHDCYPTKRGPVDLSDITHPWSLLSLEKREHGYMRPIMFHARLGDGRFLAVGMGKTPQEALEGAIKEAHRKSEYTYLPRNMTYDKSGAPDGTEGA